jgi:signal peptidase I
MSATIAIFAVVALGPHLLGYHTLTMLTGSMVPDYRPGDVLIDQQVPTRELRKGMVLTYQIPIADHRVISHRVVSVSKAADGWHVQTKGDANNGPDPWTAVIRDSRVWVVKHRIPAAGRLILWVRDPDVRPWAILALPAAALVTLLFDVWRS